MGSRAVPSCTGQLQRVASRTASLLLLLALSTIPLTAHAQPVADFYRGKTLRMIIGIEPGTAYDLYARLVTRHIGKYIPGNPTVVPQNMAGAGSLTAYNYLYNVAPRDGTAIATGHRFVPLMPLLGLPGAQFDGRHFSYIGSANREVDICMIRADSGVASLAAWKQKEVLVGTTGGGAELTTFYGSIASMLGAKMKIVTGYRSQNDLYLAIDRGEIQGRCGGSYLNLVSAHEHWLKQKTVNIVMQIGLTKDPALPGTPLFTDLVTDPGDRQALQLMLSPNDMGRPFVAPPEAPADRVSALREAFNSVMKDKDLIEEGKRQLLDIDPITGQRMAELIASAYAAPQSVIARARALVAGK